MSLENKISDLKTLKQRIDATTKMDDYIYQYIVDTLKKYDSNRSHTALALGMHLRTLRKKIVQAKELGYEVPPAKRGIKK